MSDSEIDDIERFEESRDQSLYEKAGLGKARTSQDVEFSDEEVLGLSDDESSSDNQQEYYDEAEKKASRLDKLNDWGSSRDNYYGGGDEVGQDENASADEEAEALTIQRKQLEDMDEGDFYDEEDIEGWKKEADRHDLSGGLGAQTEALPDQDPSSMTPAERREFIEENYPEVLLLSKELLNCLDTQKGLASKDVDEKVLAIQSTALRSYIAIIYSFFALFADKVKAGPVDLKEHPVMNSILKARELWRTAQRLDTASIPDNVDVEHNEALDEALNPKSESEPEPELTTGKTDEPYSMSEYSASDISEGSEEEEEEEDDADEFDIPLSTVKKAGHANRSRNDFDETADTIEQQARAKNKQSLRFYTSQVGKDKKAKTDEFQGDLDLPYKERAFERRQRLLEEARKRGQEAKDRLGDLSEGELDETPEPEGDGLYAQVQRERAMAKETKVLQQREAAEAAKQGRLDEYIAQNPSVDKRAINYMIEKNKGLTKKRKKEDRNARVKKRVRYEQAKKRLKGTRREYQQPTGAYAGELTGIRKNLTHSTRFQN